MWPAYVVESGWRGGEASDGGWGEGKVVSRRQEDPKGYWPGFPSNRAMNGEGIFLNCSLQFVLPWDMKLWMSKFSKSRWCL